ncbi:CBS domain-containing protein CBSX3, mitochondrial [Vitis vinifera]|uniref:CBS domain-containing protein CBSX3, mitochondrial n=1 Tax=Vitis vinifera TaxID=29760 RepID=A0A438F8W8_VITVI|nr:CBS domain-containing protein CBSX3, mitochondrial [Vitis vinifera]
MTEENKLITVSPNTKVLRAMQLMTDNRIRHIPVIDDKEMNRHGVHWGCGSCCGDRA